METEDEEQELPEPPMNDLVAVMAQQTRLLQALVQDRQGRHENVLGPEARLSEFLKFRPPTFDHAEDPLKADDWLREINKKLDIIHARGRDRVLLAAHQLIGMAGVWWDNYNNAFEDPENITWDEFQEAFREYHIPEGIMEMKAEEFRNLKQGAMKLSLYAPDDIDTNKKKQDRFRRGLNPALRTQLVTHIYPDFNTLMNKAILLENARSELENDHKCKFNAQR